MIEVIEHKDNVNKLIDECMLTDNVNKMMFIVQDRLDCVDIDDAKSFENQVIYYYYSLLFELLNNLKYKRIGFIKAGLIRFKEQEMPIIAEILKQVA